MGFEVINAKTLSPFVLLVLHDCRFGEDLFPTRASQHSLPRFALIRQFFSREDDPGLRESQLKRETKFASTISGINPPLNRNETSETFFEA